MPHLETARAGYLRQYGGEIEASSALAGQAIGDCLRELGRLEAALDEHTRTLEVFDRMPAEYGARQLRAHLAIARIHAKLGRKQEAEAAYTRAIEVVNPLAPDHPLRKKARAELAAMREDGGTRTRSKRP